METININSKYFTEDIEKNKNCENCIYSLKSNIYTTKVICSVDCKNHELKDKCELYEKNRINR